MEGMIITDIGVEWAAALEVKEKLGADAGEEPAVVKFPVTDLLELCMLTYTSQAARRVLLSIGSFKLEDSGSMDGFEERAAAALEGFAFGDWLDKDTSFRATCERVGEHGFASQDIEESLGAVFARAAEEELGFTPDVSLEKPGIVVYAYIHEDACHLGLDFSGADLSQRDYKVYTHPTTVRGNIAYSLVRLSGYESGKMFLDPFCGSAPFPLEAAYYGSRVPMHVQSREFPFVDFLPVKDVDWDEWFRDVNSGAGTDGLDVWALDKNNRNLKYGQNNAKIALMEKFINFSKASVGWLDTKFDEGSVDCIATQPPQLTTRANASEVEKVYDELFYQARYVLADDGAIAALMLNTDEFLKAAEKHGFKQADEKKIVTGDMEYACLKLVKAKA